MTVKEYALRQIHWQLQKDPWVQAVFLAGGGTLDELAERILAVYNYDNFDALTLEQVRYYERILGKKPDETKSLEDRRAAVQAAWNVNVKPSLALMQNICDGWEAGGVIASYDPGTLHLEFIGEVGVPDNLDDLKNAINDAAPAHIVVEYLIRYLLIREVHEVMTLTEIENTPLSSFAGGL